MLSERYLSGKKFRKYKQQQMALTAQDASICSQALRPTAVELRAITWCKVQYNFSLLTVERTLSSKKEMSTSETAIKLSCRLKMWCGTTLTAE
jgi:hypothetical protein